MNASDKPPSKPERETTRPCRRCGRGTFAADLVCSRPACSPLPSEPTPKLPSREPTPEQAARAIVGDDRPAVRAKLAAVLGAAQRLASAAQHPARDARKQAVAKYDLALADLLYAIGIQEQNDAL